VNGRNSDNGEDKAIPGWSEYPFADWLEKTYAWIYDQMRGKGIELENARQRPTRESRRTMPGITSCGGKSHGP